MGFAYTVRSEKMREAQLLDMSSLLGTAITPLGEVQAYQLGQQLRARYLDPASPDAIEGINSGLIDNSQLYFRSASFRLLTDFLL